MLLVLTCRAELELNLGGQLKYNLEESPSNTWLVYLKPKSDARFLLLSFPEKLN